MKERERVRKMVRRNTKRECVCERERDRQEKYS